MAAVKYLLYLTLLVFFFLVALIFCLRNESSVPVDFVMFQVSAVSIGGWIVASFLLGSFVGWIAALPKWLELTLAHRKRSKQLDNKQKELMRLKGDAK